MMRYDSTHKLRTRERILAAAVGRFRAEGYAGASVERVMAAAGLTVGGFYAHFRSKEALLAEALRAAMRRSREAWLAGLEDLRGRAFLDQFARRYLTLRNRDAADGCSVPALLSDLTRASPAVQRAFAAELEPLVAGVEPHLEGGAGVTARQRALGTVAMMFGALAIARATSRLPVSAEILEAARRLAAEAAPERPARPPRT